MVFVPTRRLFDHFYTHFYFTDPTLGKKKKLVRRTYKISIYSCFIKGQRMNALVRKHVHFVPEALQSAAKVLFLIIVKLFLKSFLFV